MQCFLSWPYTTYLQGQRHIRLDFDEQPLDVDLKVFDTGALDGLLHTLDQPRDEQCALGTDASAVFDHMLAQLLTGGHDSLHGVEALAQVQECELCGLHACILYPAAECDLLVLVVGRVCEVCTRRACRPKLLGAAEGKLSVGVGGDIGTVGSVFLGAFGELACLCCSFLLCLSSH